MANMNEPAPGEPWAFIGHKNGYWAGVCAGNMPPKDLKKFLGDFASKGFAITTVYSRAEYETVLGGMKHWHESPYYKPRKRKAA